MRSSTTARRYAEAAFAVAQADHATDSWLRDLKAASQVLEDGDVAEFFRDPKASREEKLQAIDKAFGSMQPHVLNLLRFLVTQGRIYLLPAITREFEALDREARGVVTATVTVARPIDQRERDEIVQRLAAATGKHVEIQVEVDPSIVGGIVVRIGDELIDASVAGRLQRLRHELAV